MNFTHYDLGYQSAGATVEVALSGSAANVKLMDEPNFQHYRRRSRHEYFGGHATQSPFYVKVPRSGHWHVAIDLGGFTGNVRTGVRVV